MTAAVKAASHFGRPQSDHSGQSTFEVRWNPSKVPSPFLSLLSGVFLNGILRITPLFLWCVPGRLFVAGNTRLFPFSPLPFSPPLFLSFFPLFTFLLPWVSLDAFVIAGNPSPLFFWRVLGCFCRSWEHLPLFSFLFLFSSLPTPPSCRDLRVGRYSGLLASLLGARTLL